MTRKKRIEDMFEIEGIDDFEVFDDYEEDEEDDDDETISLELEKGDVIELTGEDGDEKPFAILDIIEYEHSVYMVLMAVDENALEEDDDDETEDDEAHDVVILEGKEDPDDPDTLTFEAVEDDLTTRAIFAVFRERNRDEFNFVDSE